MLSRREKLLILPWQQRKYENHLRKIKSAAPVIDNRPPASREHVAIKLKRKQTEIERRMQIERDNLILLQKLNSLTCKNRVDNYWATPQPNFLNRVKASNGVSKADHETTIGSNKIITRTTQITDGRVSWKSDRNRSKSVPSQKLPSICEVDDGSSTEIRSNSSKSSISKYVPDNRRSSQRLTLNRGSLILELNFPPDSHLKYQNGHTEKLIMSGLCQCKNLTKKI
ncbi:hypothetical protein RI129_005572 [Pyrocoelia pectoralis]|uniref:Uncharacterized protein n=1 Tax=Pyrocoelia pectoralis TaxID=417401 RepID=A0AAN7ZSK7_9COLE